MNVHIQKPINTLFPTQSFANKIFNKQPLHCTPIARFSFPAFTNLNYLILQKIEFHSRAYHHQYALARLQHYVKINLIYIKNKRQQRLFLPKLYLILINRHSKTNIYIKIFILIPT